MAVGWNWAVTYLRGQHRPLDCPGHSRYVARKRLDQSGLAAMAYPFALASLQGYLCMGTSRLRMQVDHQHEVPCRNDWPESAPRSQYSLDNWRLRVVHPISPTAELRSMASADYSYLLSTALSAN